MALPESRLMKLFHESKVGSKFSFFAQYRVIQTTNAYDIGIINGETGYIKSKT